MTSINIPCKYNLRCYRLENVSIFHIQDEVAIIDEIQQLRDPGRGWAWTRALLGLLAEEIHVCGEPGSAEILKRLCETTGEDLEVSSKYLFNLIILKIFYNLKDQALQKTDRIECRG